MCKNSFFSRSIFNAMAKAQHFTFRASAPRTFHASKMKYFAYLLLHWRHFGTFLSSSEQLTQLVKYDSFCTGYPTFIWLI